MAEQGMTYGGKYKGILSADAETQQKLLAKFMLEPEIKIFMYNDFNYEATDKPDDDENPQQGRRWRQGRTLKARSTGCVLSRGSTLAARNQERT